MGRYEAGPQISLGRCCVGSIGVSQLRHCGAGPRLLRRGSLQAGAGVLGGGCLQLVLQVLGKLHAGFNCCFRKEPLLPGCRGAAKAMLCCCCSVAKLCLTLCDPMDCSTPGFPVLHYLPEFAQTIASMMCQSSHPLLPPSPLVLNLSQHQGLFQSVGTSHQVAKVPELQHQFSQ